MVMSARQASKLVVPKLNLLSYTRNTDKVRTRIHIDNRMEFDDDPQPLWIECGDIQINKREREPVWTIAARMSYGVTDFEHDSAYAFMFEAIGFEFESSYFGNLRFTGWIHHAEAEQFKIPNPGYDPTKDPKTGRCGAKVCKAEAKSRKQEPHLIVERFVPPPNKKMFELLKGKRFFLTFGSYEAPEKP